jgi:hypothetical protein
MIKIAMSPAASALLRALIARAQVSHDRILLMKVHSVDWQSLTFTGERHEIYLRIPGPDSREIARRLCGDLEEAEFSIPGIIVVDIVLAGQSAEAPDGSTTLTIEALTVVAD